MRILILGVRGVPGVEGGVETHAEHLYPRLAAQGCDVEIIVRTPFIPREQRRFGAIRLRRIWAPRRPGLEAFLHSVLGVIYAALVRPDILHIHAIGPAIVTPMARVLGLTVIVTNHGPDYNRDKWGPVARRVLRLGESFGMRYAHGRIAISKVIAEMVELKYRRQSEIIPNGVLRNQPCRDTDQIEQFGLHSGRYFLQVGRLVPEKRQLDLIQAYRSVSPREWQLVLVGRIADDPYSTAVSAAAREAGVVITGFQSGQTLRQLYSHAGAFVLPSSHEGLPIALLEALSYGVPTLASAIPANLDVGLDKASYFPLGDTAALAMKLKQLSAQPWDAPARAERQRWVTERYDWDRIADQTMEMYSRTIDQES